MAAEMTEQPSGRRVGYVRAATETEHGRLRAQLGDLDQVFDDVAAKPGRSLPGLRACLDSLHADDPVSYTHLTLPTNREV